MTEVFRMSERKDGGNYGQSQCGRLQEEGH